MKVKYVAKTIGNILGIISVVIALIVAILILNLFFKITPYQQLQGLPLMITIFTSPVGFVLGIISMIISSNSYAKWGIISNTILFLLLPLYWYLGTIIFGP